MSTLSNSNYAGRRPQTCNPSRPGFYPQPQPTNTFRVNPLAFSSLKNLDVDELQDTFGKAIQEKQHLQESERIELEKMFNESEEIQKIKQTIKNAKLNQFRAKQIHENQARRMQNIIKDSEIDEVVLSNLEEERLKQQEIENKKRQERLQTKYALQQQMRDRAKEREESMKEYMRHKRLVDDQVRKIIEEDLAERAENERKKAIARSYMENAYKEKAERKIKEKQEEELQKEKERKYFEEVAKREKEHAMKKAAVQEEKDKIFEKLCQEKARQQAEKDYWENVRNELYMEQENRKIQIAELEEKAKKQRQKEEMLQSAIEQMKIKEERKKEEERMENEFKKKLMEKFKEDERLEQYNAIRRKQKELDLKNEIEKQWKLKLEQYQKQKEQELQELEDAKRKEAQRRVLIEQEKARLIKENEDLLKSYYAKGYYKSVSSLENPNSINGSNTQSSYSYTNNSGNTSKAVMGSSYSSNY